MNILQKLKNTESLKKIKDINEIGKKNFLHSINDNKLIQDFIDISNIITNKHPHNNDNYMCCSPVRDRYNKIVEDILCIEIYNNKENISIECKIIPLYIFNYDDEFHILIDDARYNKLLEIKNAIILTL